MKRIREQDKTYDTPRSMRKNIVGLKGLPKYFFQAINPVLGLIDQTWMMWQEHKEELKEINSRLEKLEIEADVEVEIEEIKESHLNRVVKKVINERKKRKPKKIKDDKYTIWCKEHGWEDGVSEDCVDDALESEDVQMRSWAIGFIMGDKQC